jgi:hypothetical protein
MLIWSGQGILVVLVAIAGMFVGSYISVVTGLESQEPPPFGLGFGLIMAAAGTFFLARHADNPAKQRMLVDPVTNEHFIVKDGSSLFFIPLRFWTYILAVLGIFAIIALK